MLARAVLCGVVLTFAGEALAGDGSACRKARRKQNVDGWTSYVLAHPDGKCVDEALGELLVLAAGRMISGMVGDPTQFALAAAQVAHTDPSQLAALSSMLGGMGGLGGTGGLGGMSGMSGLSGLSGLSGMEGLDGAGLLGALGGDGGYGEIGGLGGLIGSGDYGDDGEIYVSYVVDHVDGSWNDGEFWNVLDATRPTLQRCYGDLGADPMAISYVAAFEVTAGKVAVHTLERTWSEDGQPHDDVDACVKRSLEGAAFPAELTGKYSYRIDLY